MNYDNFEKLFRPDRKSSPGHTPIPQLTEEVREFAARYHGVQFGGGLFSSIDDSLRRKMTPYLHVICPEGARSIYPLLITWCGDMVGIACRRRGDTVVVLSPEECALTELDCTLSELFEVPELYEYVFIGERYQQWLTAGGRPPGLSDCIGLKVPAYLGGEYVIDNMERINTEVYWDITLQISSQLRDDEEE